MKHIWKTIALFTSLSSGGEAMASCGIGNQFAFNGDGTEQKPSAWASFTKSELTDCRVAATFFCTVRTHAVVGPPYNQDGYGYTQGTFGNDIGGAGGVVSFGPTIFPAVATISDLQDLVDEGDRISNENNLNYPTETYAHQQSEITECLASPVFNAPTPHVDDQLSKDSCGSIGSQQKGSIIGCRDRSLSQQLSVAGTPFHLRYSSKRINQTGLDDRTVSMKIPHFSYPLVDTRFAMTKAVMTLRIEDANITLAVDSVDNNFAPYWQAVIHWDGKDSSGNTVVGPIAGIVKAGYQYDAGWQGPTSTLYKYPITLQRGAYPDYLSMGGWSLDMHHGFDRKSSNLRLGTGEDVPLGKNGTYFQAAADGKYHIPSFDSSEIFVFDNQGKHLSTRDASTGIVKYTFQYTSEVLF